MTTKTDVMLERLDSILEQLEALGITPTGPSTTPASVNPDGSPGLVAPGEIIESAWGNAVANEFQRIRPSVWTAVTFQNSWANAGGPTQPTQWRRDEDRVEVRLTVGTGTSGTVAFTLPVGYRPLALIRRTLDGSGAHAYAEVATDGTVKLAGTAPISGEFSFSVNS